VRGGPGLARNSEFTAENEYQYDQKSPVRWILSHAGRYRFFAGAAITGFIVAWLCYSGAQIMIGRAANELVAPSAPNALLMIALTIFGLLVLDAISILVGSFMAENIAARFEADARRELYVSLLGKSKTFHDRQRAGDIMARATDDVNQLSNMIVPGATLVYETILGVVVTVSYIASIRLELALVPLVFVAAYIITAKRYMARLSPVIAEQREQYGKMNAGLEEAVSGIEVVKASARELFEQSRFRRNARLFRDLFVAQGSIEARYLPLLLYGIAVGATFLHAMLLYRAGTIPLGSVVATMGLMTVLRFPTFISIFAFSVLQSGIASAGRILSIIKAETDLDENSRGHSAPIQGEIVFEGVSFGYVGHGRAEAFAAENPSIANGQGNASAQHALSTQVLQNISFTIRPGQTVAIVGQTGSGKSALTQLVNRTYDVNEGRLLIDGIDVRAWSLDSLRSQIAKIEQDIFLFSRSIADNIAFGAPNATREQVEAAAKAAQAHEFISGFPEGYETVVGERGMTLSGGQRQRIALARAFLNNPRILILDDSTSAIDSATEDQIQQALREAQKGRTTLLITHRLSQIRWADLILVLDGGQLSASGSHEELLRTSSIYRRIFARYDAELPPIAEAGGKRQEAETLVSN
jgi:ATP-binding cassette, subfamily B, bacterial